MQLMVTEEFRKYKEKKDKKSSKPIVGFSAYTSAPKKKSRKKKEDAVLLNKKDVE
jgi:hypothetical protein